MTDHILSIQSHVAYGYVGNRAAVFPLQRLGFDVIAINTVQFSNHTGYGTWEGDIFSSDHIQHVLNGVEQRLPFHQLKAVLSGYLGDAVLGELVINTVQKAKRENPSLIYCCDPVLGDIGRGIFVKPAVADFFKNNVCQVADILTPNQFELSFLSGQSIQTLDDALKACAILRQQGGPAVILVTSLQRQEAARHTIEMLVSTKTGAWLVATPYLPIDPAPNGGGDLTAAVFLAHYLRTGDPALALSFVASVVFAVYKKTHALHQRELALVAAQDEWVTPQQIFVVTQVDM